MLPTNYGKLENSQKIRLLRTKVFFDVLQYEFYSAYGKDWWKSTLLPRMKKLAQPPLESGDETAKKYAAYFMDLDKKKAAPKPENMDVSVMATALLFDDGFKKLPCSHDRQKTDALHKLRLDRNAEAHNENTVDRTEQVNSLRLMKNVIRLYGKDVFEPDVVNAIENYDFDEAERARQAAFEEAQRQKAVKNEFGAFYGQYEAACTAMKDPATRANGLNSLLELARAGFPTAARDAVQVLLHDAALFSLEKAIDALEHQTARTRAEDAQLVLLRELLGKQNAARSGDAAAADELARRFGDKNSAVYTPGRDLEFALLAWRNDRRYGMKYLYDAARQGRTEAVDAIEQSGDAKTMDRLAKEIAGGKLAFCPQWEAQLPWLLRLMDDGSRAALDILVEHYQFGAAIFCWGATGPDPQRCRVCKKACEAGIAEVLQHKIYHWQMACNAPDYKAGETFALCERLAQEGPKGAQALLGACYVAWTGCEWNYGKARPLLEAGLSSPEYSAFAHYWLGVIAEYDRKAHDLAAAAAHYRQAAAAGFAPAMAETYILDAAGPDKAARLAAVQRLHSQMGAYEGYTNIGVWSYRGIDAKNDRYVAMILLYKSMWDCLQGVAAGGTVNLALNLTGAHSLEQMLDALHREERGYAAVAASQAEALYLLTRSGKAEDLARARERWAQANSRLRDQIVPAGQPRHWGLFRSHGRKDLIARALQTGLNGQDPYTLLSAAGFRIPHRRIDDGHTMLFGVPFEHSNVFYRWLCEVYLDRFDAQRSAAVQAACPAKNARMLWYAAAREVTRQHLPGRPDREGAVCYHLAKQGRREYFDRLYAGRTALSGLDRCQRNVDLCTLSADPAQRRALLEEAIRSNAAPTPYAQSVLYCLRGRECEDPAQEQVWYGLAEKADPGSAAVHWAQLAYYNRQKKYEEAADKADEWLTAELVDRCKEGHMETVYDRGIEIRELTFEEMLNVDRRTYTANPRKPQKKRRLVYRLPQELPMEACLADEYIAEKGLVHAGVQAYTNLYQTKEDLTWDQKKALSIKMEDPSKLIGSWRTYEHPVYVSPRQAAEEERKRKRKALLQTILVLLFLDIAIPLFLKSLPLLILASGIALLAFVAYSFWKRHDQPGGKPGPGT